MRQPLDKILRKKLEDTVVKARDIVEIAVNEALQRLGVADSQAPGYLNDEQRVLRNTLRAHARQLGDKLTDGKQEIERLANEMAYEHWHRMLFARYLEQNNLLMYDEYTPVTLDECFELAEEEPDCKDGWELAGRLAQKMLPQIFRADSPVFAVKLSINHINELENLISELDPATYQAQDSLGWCYQFWQNKKKKQVNESGVKIGAQELSPVTQLFTEPYMVSFLLDNTLGAWWASKCLTADDYIRANTEQELRDKASIQGVSLEYLRFIKNDDSGHWQLAVGGYEEWPEELSKLKILDPCCGSGHFLVAVFLMLVPIRMQIDGLSAKEAVDSVLKDNIHGLELDKRCVELAAFALSLEAWRFPNSVGYRLLPELQLACTGISIAEVQKEWKELAKGDEVLSDAIILMQKIFKDAEILGSLIEPSKWRQEDQTPPWTILLQKMVSRAGVSSDTKNTTAIFAKSAEMLSNKYNFIVTNVPYLGIRKQSEKLKAYCLNEWPISKGDLATVFIDKCLKYNATESALISVVTPSALLNKAYFSDFRRYLLKKTSIPMIAVLGGGAFETISGEVVDIILGTFKKCSPNEGDNISFLDASNSSIIVDKKKNLKEKCIFTFSPQNEQLKNPDSKIQLTTYTDSLDLLSDICECPQGIKTGDDEKWTRFGWEFYCKSDGWEYLQSGPTGNGYVTGLYKFINWSSNGIGMIRPRHDSPAIGRFAVGVSQTGARKISLFIGYRFDSNIAPLLPTKESNLVGMYAFCTSGEFESLLSENNRGLYTTNSALMEVPFDCDIWNLKSQQLYPFGLPLPFSNDPSQWIFHGHPCASVIFDENNKTTVIGELRQDGSVLQVAAARLLGYQWPAELDAAMELAPEMRQVMKKNSDFNELVDDDGIVCIPAVRGEKTAAKRLADILYKSYGDTWSSSVEDNLLKSVKAKDWDSWLRDKFFEQHCKLFQHRPFIWHIWDGLKDGFSALVNYHKLDYKGLERLIYTYLDDWISIQKRNIADGVDGADIRLTAAENLRIQLEAILEGEKGLDIFVRWKPLEEQPIGWNPDLNDGVRLNIRPFMLAKDVGKKGAGVLRVQPNILWKKDRGTDVESAPWYHLGLQYGGNLGDRINDHHLTLAEKREARENKGL